MLILGLKVLNVKPIQLSRLVRDLYFNIGEMSIVISALMTLRGRLFEGGC